MAADAHAVGLRDLRHHTSEVLARVRRGETIDVTEHGRLIARIVPVGNASLPRCWRAWLSPGGPPWPGALAPAKDASRRWTDRLSGTLAALRDEERW